MIGSITEISEQNHRLTVRHEASREIHPSLNLTQVVAAELRLGPS